MLNRMTGVGHAFSVLGALPSDKSLTAPNHGRCMEDGVSSERRAALMTTFLTVDVSGARLPARRASWRTAYRGTCSVARHTHMRETVVNRILASPSGGFRRAGSMVRQ